MRFIKNQLTSAIAVLFLLLVFNSCESNLDAPGRSSSQSSTSPNPVPSASPVPIPTLTQDFLDKIGVPTGSMQMASGDLSGMQGTTVSVSGFDAQVSLDGVAWSNAIVVNSNSSTLLVRMTADPVANVVRVVEVNAGGLILDWAVSTHAAVQTFNTPGATTYTKLPVGRTLKVECWGGGGGGTPASFFKQAGGGGGGGGYSMRILDRALIGATENLTIGAGGTIGLGADSGVPATAGGNSSFGAHLSAGGGGAGQPAAQVNAIGGLGITANGFPGNEGIGGNAGGPGGGLGGSAGVAGAAPGGGGGGSDLRAGAAGAGAGGAGRCVVTVQP